MSPALEDYMQQLQQGKVLKFDRFQYKETSCFWKTDNTIYQFYYYSEINAKFHRSLEEFEAINYIRNWDVVATTSFITKDELAFILLEHGQSL